MLTLKKFEAVKFRSIPVIFYEPIIYIHFTEIIYIILTLHVLRGIGAMKEENEPPSSYFYTNLRFKGVIDSADEEERNGKVPCRYSSPVKIISPFKMRFLR